MSNLPPEFIVVGLVAPISLELMRGMPEILKFNGIDWNHRRNRIDRWRNSRLRVSLIMLQSHYFLKQGNGFELTGGIGILMGLPSPAPPTRGQLPAGNVELKLVKSARDERAGETEKQVARM